MNTIDVSYSDKSFRDFAPERMVKSFLRKVLAYEKLKNVEFSVSFVYEDEIHEMNKNYRSIDDSTDILSFAENDNIEGFEFVNEPGKKRNLGDIVICEEVCKRNAETFSVSANEELHRLLIHGVLHLSGMDHKTNDIEKEDMLKHQEEVLKKLFLVQPFRSEL